MVSVEAQEVNRALARDMVINFFAENKGFLKKQLHTALHDQLCDDLHNISKKIYRERGMELHEFHILQWESGAQDHAVAVAGAGVSRGAGEIGPAVSSSGEYGHMAAKPMQGAIVHTIGDNAAALAVFHDQIYGEILNKELRIVFERLLIQRMQHCMTRSICGGAGALRRTLAKMGRHPAKGPLINLALLGA